MQKRCRVAECARAEQPSQGRLTMRVLQADLERQSQLLKEINARPPAKFFRRFAALWWFTRLVPSSYRGVG